MTVPGSSFKRACLLTATFSHGLEGKGTGCRSVAETIAVLSEETQTLQFLICSMTK